MSDLDSHSNIKHCPFPVTLQTNLAYVCYESETCCEWGCCSTTAFKFNNFWYYWLFLLAVVCAFSAGSWLCRRIERAPNNRRQRNLRGFHHNCSLVTGDEHIAAIRSNFVRSTYLGNLPTCSQDEYIALGRLSSSDDPPSYTSITQDTVGSPPKYNTLLQSSEYEHSDSKLT